ncbi:TnsD family Tn7-like transposition protein [Paraburkholderia graminis]|uniref:TnsD family Tn7-like transposition protein n=1 Tax=Paraburkholderia graminis TaxID=60548 RepID=UPI003522AD37
MPAPFLVVLLCAAEGIEASPVKHERHSLEVGSARSDAAVLEKKRSQWSEHCSAHVDATCTQLRQALPAVWSWLYRHDRGWLRENQRPKKSPFGGRRTHDLPLLIDAAISSIRHDVREHPRGREPLPSAYQFRLALGMNETVFNQIPALMQAAGRSAQLPGRREVFISRRVHFAVEQLGQAGAPLDIATVSREARLRISTVAEHCSIQPRTNDTQTFSPPRTGASYFRGREVHVVPAPASDGIQAQPLAAKGVDATKPNAAGPRTARKHSGERR